MSKAKLNNKIAKYESERNKIKLHNDNPPHVKARLATINEILSTLYYIKGESYDVLHSEAA